MWGLSSASNECKSRGICKFSLLMQSVSMCFIVRGMLHSVHMGLSFRSIKYECVSNVCPMRSLVKTTSSLLVKVSSLLFQASTVFLISRNLLFVCNQCFCQSLRMCVRVVLHKSCIVISLMSMLSFKVAVLACMSTSVLCPISLCPGSHTILMLCLFSLCICVNIFLTMGWLL